MSNYDKFCLLMSILILILIAFSAGHGIGYQKGKSEMVVVAVMQGHAEYFIKDANTGKTDWRWKP